MALLALWAGVSASAQEVERFRHFMEEGVMDLGIPAAMANEVVGQGIASEQAVIVDMTLRAMREHAAYMANDFLRRNILLPHRDFAQVPRLKEFLIEHWRARARESGYNTSAVRERETSGIGDLDLVEQGPEGNDVLADGAWERIGEEVRERMSAWTSIPRILAVYCEVVPLFRTAR